MKQNKIVYVNIIIISALIVFGCGKKIEKNIVIDGSRTMEPLIKAAAETYEKKHAVAINKTSSGSLKGITRLLEGKIDIATSSVKIPSQQMWESQQKGIVLKEFVVAYDTIIPVVHPSNPVKNLFLGQLADMYTGLIKDWKNVEGKPGKIIVVDRDDASGTKLLMNEKFFESKNVVEGSIVKKTDDEVVSYVAKHPTAVGYTSKRYYNKSVKTITVNGFKDTLDNIEKGYYPLYRELYLYVNEKSYSGEIRSFIDFIMSKEGQVLQETIGFIPVNRLNKPIK